MFQTVSGYFETLQSRDSTTSCRLVASRLLFLDTSRLCSGHFETIGHFETFLYFGYFERVMDNSRLGKFATGQFATFANFYFGQFATFNLDDSRLSFWTIRDFFCRESSKIIILRLCYCC